MSSAAACVSGGTTPVLCRHIHQILQPRRSPSPPHHFSSRPAGGHTDTNVNKRPLSLSLKSKANDYFITFDYFQHRSLSPQNVRRVQSDVFRLYFCPADSWRFETSLFSVRRGEQKQDIQMLEAAVLCGNLLPCRCVP